MIKIEHLKKVYPNVTPLKDVNAVINDGDVIAIIGPSGTGKSTLMRCINQLENPTAGHVWIDDEEITEDLSVIIGTLDGYDSWMLENKKLVS